MNNLSLSTTKERYEELKKTPLLFLRMDAQGYWEKYKDGSSEYIINYYWRPIDETCHKKISISEEEARLIDNRYRLVVLDNSIDTSEGQGEFVDFEIWDVSADDINCWIYILNSYLQRAQDKNDFYPYIFLLWFLNNYWWTKDILLQALYEYSDEYRQILGNGIKNISMCLSLAKQQSVQWALNEIGIEYTIYYLDFIEDALQYIMPKKVEYSQNNLFELVDYIMLDDHIDNFEQTGIERNFPDKTENKLILLHKWLNDNNAEFSYQDLPNFYCLVDVATQLCIIQRYFHDVRLGKTVFDVNLLEMFKENPYSHFSRYRYCVNMPQEKVEIGNSLLADCLITLYNTHGKSFQEFNGILDFVVKHCDVTQPAINLGLETFIPKCDGGAVRNPSFLGFINYDIVYKLDETKLSESYLLEIIRNLLYHYRQPHYKCSSSNNYILDDTGMKCSAHKCEYIEEIFEEDLRIVPTEKIELLDLFLNKHVVDNDQNKGVVVDIHDISFSKLLTRINGFVSEHILNNGLYTIESKDLSTEIGKIVKECSLPISMRIYPQDYPIIGVPYDIILGIKGQYEVKRRCIESLSKELQAELQKYEYFEVPYNENKLKELKSLYYSNHVQCIDKSKIKDEQKSFLKSKGKSKDYLFCAPELAKEKNKAINLPFFWCRGTECFCNSLQRQTLNDCTSWRRYSLFHMAEIMGYPKIHDTEAGYEPDIIIRKFIFTANRVLKKFNRLKCRSCGHLLYSEKSNGYNRYSYYSCINRTCKEYMKPVYLNYCYKCKTGLIDSRDSKQCPNGWYICPECNSCCDDDQYERLAQRYIIEHRPIPERIKSKYRCGHNDKYIYFCHKCGSKLENTQDDSHWRCPTCDEVRKIKSSK